MDSRRSRRCGNVRKLPELQGCGKAVCRPVGKGLSFSIGMSGSFPHFHDARRSTNDQPVYRQRHIPHRHDQPPDQNETTDYAADNKVQCKQGDPSTQGTTARHDPEAHPMLTFWTRIERSTLRNSRQPSMPSLIFAMSVRRKNRQSDPKNRISKTQNFLSKFLKSVRVQLANTHHAAYKNLPVTEAKLPGEGGTKKRCKPRKKACSGAFWRPREDLNLRPHA